MPEELEGGELEGAEGLEAELGGEEGGEEGGETRTVSWDDHVKLRHENAEYRKKWSPYEETFSNFDDDGRQGWLEFIQLAHSDPEAAKVQMLYSLVGEEGLAALGIGGEQQQFENPQYGQQDQPQYLTQDQFQSQLEAAFAYREQQQQDEQAVAGVEAQAEQLGYEPGSLQYIQLLHTALDQFDGDLEQAHEAFQSWRQEQANEFLRSKGDDDTPSPVQPGVGPGGEQTTPKDTDEARAQFASFLGSKP